MLEVFTRPAILSRLVKALIKYLLQLGQRGKFLLLTQLSVYFNNIVQANLFYNLEFIRIILRV